MSLPECLICKADYQPEPDEPLVFHENWPSLEGYTVGVCPTCRKHAEVGKMVGIYPSKEDIVRLKLNSEERKEAHKKSKQCETYLGIPCGGCHFWSGVIAACDELLLGEEAKGEAK